MVVSGRGLLFDLFLNGLSAPSSACFRAMSALGNVYPLHIRIWQTCSANCCWPSGQPWYGQARWFASATSSLSLGYSFRNTVS